MPDAAFDFHGLSLSITASDAAVADAVAQRLRRFPPAAGAPSMLRFEYTNAALRRPRGEARTVYESQRGAMLYHAEADRLWIETGDGVHALCAPGEGTATISTGPDAARRLWLLSRPLLTLPLLEMAKRHGRFGLHAAAVAVDGAGILLPGATGSGKSTLALALALGGLDLLGDDFVFLRSGADGIRALALPDDFDLTDETAALFGDLDGLLLDHDVGDWPKRRLPLEHATSALALQSRPVAMVFPRVAHTASSRVVPLDRSEALLDLVPNVLLTHPGASRDHLDALGRLVAQCRCYRLETGTDLGALPELMRGIVSETVAVAS
jgi:hypothetical protein